MKGGGVKGIAFVGAIEVLNNYGFEFRHYVGTSAGAISAALLAAGYAPSELKDVLAATDFRKFKDSAFPLPLALALIPFTKGLYRGDAFMQWLEGKLRKKWPGFDDAIPIRFKHLKDRSRTYRRLTIFASTKDKRFHAFDSEDPASVEYEIAYACRCSMAIPYFFRPERLGGQWVFDGGMQNNYPVYALVDFNKRITRRSDFVGLYLGEKGASRSQKWLLYDLLSIWAEAGDKEALEEFKDRTVVIDPRPIKTTDFSLTSDEVDFLISEGRASALKWLYHCNHGNRPSDKEVQQALEEAARLRELVSSERRKRSLRNRVIAVLVLLLCFIGLLYAMLK